MLSYSNNPWARPLMLITTGVLGMVIGLVLANLTPSSTHDHMSPLELQAPPATLEELVSKSDVIAVATVGDLVHEDSFLGYDAQGNLIKAAQEGLPDDAEIPFYDYQLRLDHILKADSPLQPGHTLSLRVYIKATPTTIDANLEYPPSAPGDQYLFFLTQNPDRQTYGLDDGLVSRLIINESVVRISDKKRTPVLYYDQMTPAAFTQKVQDILKQQGR